MRKEKKDVVALWGLVPVPLSDIRIWVFFAFEEACRGYHDAGLVCSRSSRRSIVFLHSTFQENFGLSSALEKTSVLPAVDVLPDAFAALTCRGIHLSTLLAFRRDRRDYQCLGEHDIVSISQLSPDRWQDRVKHLVCARQRKE